MEINIRPEFEAFIREQIQAGRFQSESDVLNAALAALRQQDLAGEFDSSELQELIAEGEQSIRAEGTVDGQAAFEARRERRRQLRSKAG